MLKILVLAAVIVRLAGRGNSGTAAASDPNNANVPVLTPNKNALAADATASANSK